MGAAAAAARFRGVLRAYVLTLPLLLLLPEGSDAQTVVADVDMDALRRMLIGYLGSRRAVWLVFLSGFATGAFTYAWSVGFPTTLPAGVSLAKQSEEVPGIPHSMSSLVFPRTQKLPESLDENVTTLRDLIFNASAPPSSPAMGFRPPPPNAYQPYWHSYEDVQRMVLLFCSGLSSMGYRPGRHIYLGCYARPSLELAVVEYSCYSMGFVFVPVYDAFGFVELRRMLQRTSMRVIVTDDHHKARFLLQYPARTIRSVICTFEPSQTLVGIARRKFVRLRSFEEVLSLGERRTLDPNRFPRLRSSQHAMLLFNERVPGQLEGVILRHSHVLSAASSINLHLDNHAMTDHDVYFSYLPRRHAVDLSWQAAILMKRGAVAFCTSNNRELLEDMKVLRPTVVLVVPAILNRIYDKVQVILEDKMTMNQVSRLGISSKVRYLSRGIINRDTIWDRILFRKLRGRFGNRVRVMVVYGAYINADVLTFTRCYMGCPVLVSYGTSTSSGVCTMTYPGDHMAESVGVPVPGNFVNLVDVGAYGHMEPAIEPGKAHSPVGEISVSGATITNVAYSAQFGVSHASGDSFPTGDLGRILANGTLQVVGRADENIKLAQGEWLVPSRVEGILEKRCRTISQVLLYTERYQSMVVALIFPDYGVIRSVGGSSLRDISKEELANDPIAHDIVFEEIAYASRTYSLKSYEIPKAIKLVPKPLYGIGTGLLALRPRNAVIDTYRSELSELIHKVGTAKGLEGVL